MQRLLCAFGLLPWLFHFCCIYENNPHTFHKFIPLGIFVNGILYHIMFPENQFVLGVDLLCNNIFITYINTITENQPETFACTGLSIFAFCINYLLKIDMIHVVLVQWLLLFAYIKSHHYHNNFTDRYEKICQQIDVNLFLCNINTFFLKEFYNISMDDDEIDFDYRINKLLSRIQSKDVGNIDDLLESPSNEQEPNIIQDITAETEGPTNNLTVRRNHHKLRHDESLDGPRSAKVNI